MAEKTKKSKAEKICNELEKAMNAVVRDFFVLPNEKESFEGKAAFDKFFTNALKTQPKTEDCDKIGECLGVGSLAATALLNADERILSFPQQNKLYCNSISKAESSIMSIYYRWLLEMIEEVIAVCPKRQGPDGSRLTHRKRRQALDRCLKLLMRIEPGEKETGFMNSLNRILARAYLYRGALIRIKGFSIPAKKKEAIKKAEEALQNIKQADMMPEDIIFNSEIYLDLEEIGEIPKDIDAYEFFADSAIKLYERVEKDPEFISKADEVFLHNVRLNSEPWGLEEIIESHQTEILSKARAAFFLNRPEAVVLVEKAIQHYGNRAFTFPCWRNLAELIHQMAEQKVLGWEKLSFKLWQACYAKETMTLHNSLIRWYWSHQQDIYDLAFFAATDPAIKVEIADSLKGRTVLHRQVLEEMARDNKEIERFISEENDGFLGRYIKNLQPEAIQGKTNPQQKIPFDQLPDDWMSVHLYVSNGYYDSSLKNVGYASIYDGKTKDWLERTFDADSIWNAFQNWQEGYASHSRKKESAPEMLELCKTLGDKLGFLFDENIFASKRPVLFVPFGFLHRVPLHMAVTKDRDGFDCVWAQDHPSMFLPSWPGKDRVPADSRAGEPGTDILLRNFEEHENRYQALIKQWDKTFCKLSCPVSALLEMKKEFSLEENGRVNHLFVFTHGLSHSIDPYASSLKFADGELRLIRLLSVSSDRLDVSGAGVLLGACEADMMPPQLTVVDEHLSFSAVFLEKGASQVLSGLYQVVDASLEELAVSLKGKDTHFYQALWNWHSSRCEEYIYTDDDQLDEEKFFRIASFRVLGYPK